MLVRVNNGWEIICRCRLMNALPSNYCSSKREMTSVHGMIHLPSPSGASFV
jgi:hypothetical protein